MHEGLPIPAGLPGIDAAVLASLRAQRRRIEVERFEDSIAAYFLHLLHGTAPSEEWTRAMQASLILYAEHEFNASTFTARVIAGTGIGHLFVP